MNKLSVVLGWCILGTSLLVILDGVGIITDLAVVCFYFCLFGFSFWIPPLILTPIGLFFLIFGYRFSLISFEQK